MKNTRKCENCIWFDKCAQEIACDDYCPASYEEEEAELVSEYKNGLQRRHEYYKELVEEQNS